MEIGVFSITSPFDDFETVNKGSERFLKNIENHVDYEMVFRGEDFSDFGSYTLNLIFVRTGGSEAVFKELYPKLRGPIYLLTSGVLNSLAASMEILSFLRHEGRHAEIFHGSTEYISGRINAMIKVRNAINMLDGTRYGVIGTPADWLIASSSNYKAIKEKLGVNIIDIPIEELLEEVDKKEYPESARSIIKHDFNEEALDGAFCVYGALKRIAEKYQLSGFTVRCFDILKARKTTSCLALAMMNSEGIVGSCEGDVPAMISIAIMNALTGNPGFQANPSSIDVERNEMVFAHCTVPLNMVKSYKFETHFESGLSVAVRGVMPTGPATIFKTSGDLSNYFVSNATIINNTGSPQLCRTQVVVKLDKKVNYFLTESIGNHHIVSIGRNEALVNEFFKAINKV